MVDILISFFFETYKKLVELFVFLKQERKKSWIISTPFKTLNYNILVCKLVNNTLQ